jgi:hypothetical protein
VRADRRGDPGGGPCEQCDERDRDDEPETGHLAGIGCLAGRPEREREGLDTLG